MSAYLTLDALFPERVREVDAATVYAHPAGSLRANMVASVDGAAAVEGRVGLLTGPADHRLLVLLRSLCDVLLVGAGTVRAEGYGPVRARPELAEVRRALGQAAHPRLAVLTRNVDLDLRSPAFTDAPERPIVVTTKAAGRDRLRAAGEVAEVLVAGEHSVDLGLARSLLADLELARILTEGGPTLLAALYAADLVDELCLAVSPVITGSSGPRLLDGPALPQPRSLRLGQVCERDDFLFLRYQRP